jgi:hypothetical protein
MSIRLDKCSSFGLMKCQSKNYTQILPNISLNTGNIPATPIGDHFVYLGRIFDASLNDDLAKRNITARLKILLKTISNLRIKPQTKLKIFSQFIPSQFAFDLKIYNLSNTWIADNLDSLCTSALREWIEAPISSCIKDWMIVPLSQCGLGIPSFQNRAESFRLQKRNALKNSMNENLRDLYADSTKANISPDALLSNEPFKLALKTQKKQQLNAASKHFLELESQGQIARAVIDQIPGKQISVWSKSLVNLSGYLFNFTRKAIQSQLPTFSNLHKWGRASSNLCPMCGLIQSNKHVLSNCSSNGALNRYTLRHNKALSILVEWLSQNIATGMKVFHDLSLEGSNHITDFVTFVLISRS